MKRQVAVGLIVVGLLVAGNAADARASESFVFGRSGPGTPGALSVESETALGTRDARPFGERGVEQRLRFQAGVLTGLSFEASAGALFDSAENLAGAWDVGARWSFLHHATHGVNGQLTASWRNDYQGVAVPRLGLLAGKSWAGFDAVATGLAEFPVRSPRRDEVDVIFGGGVSSPLTSRVRLGAELMGEDLEGLWEAEEAEGGAKLLAGPTLAVGAMEFLDVRINASGYVPLTRNEPTRVEPGVSVPGGPGFLGRVIVSYAF